MRCGGMGWDGTRDVNTRGQKGDQNEQGVTGRERGGAGGVRFSQRRVKIRCSQHCGRGGGGGWFGSTPVKEEGRVVGSRFHFRTSGWHHRVRTCGRQRVRLWSASLSIYLSEDCSTWRQVITPRCWKFPRYSTAAVLLLFAPQKTTVLVVTAKY